MSNRLKIILLIVAVLVLALIIFKSVKKKAVKKVEMDTYGGYTRSEFKQNLEQAWKDRYYKITMDALRLPENWAKDWRLQIDQSISETGKSLEDALLEAAQFSWAKDNPKASDNVWSSGWLSEVYVRGQLGLDPTDPKIKEVILEI
jgi:hypothetical protein